MVVLRDETELQCGSMDGSFWLGLRIDLVRLSSQLRFADEVSSASVLFTMSRHSAAFMETSAQSVEVEEPESSCNGMINIRDIHIIHEESVIEGRCSRMV